MSVELLWDGKYDGEGRKHSPLRLALPFQTVETVNESVQERQRMLDMFSESQTNEWRNRLIWGDKKYVLPSLLPDFRGKVDLIYIDPPFNTGANFSFEVEVEGEEFIKEPSMIEQKAYRDTWGRGLDSYLQWFYEMAVILRELLSDKGSIYVHCDWRVNSFLRVLLNEIFSSERYVNEIVWKSGEIKGARGKSKKFGKLIDYILLYTKSEKYTFNNVYKPYDLNSPNNKFIHKDKDGRIYSRDCPLGDYSQEKIREFEAQGRIYVTKNGKKQLIRYLDELQGTTVGELWDDIDPINQVANERLNYSTQKPEALLKRIIEASSKEGDLILDCFCGSGTTAAVAEKLNRRWITCDLGRFAIHTARKRLLSIPDVKPFEVQNLGKYERQAWQADEFGPNATERVVAYTKFILELYHAQALTGFVWLHGIKDGRAVHVGSVDSPVTLTDVKSILIEWRKNLGKTGTTNIGIDVLGWEFALDMNETAKQQAAEVGVDVRFLTIPREVLEKKAVEQGDIQFFELAALFVESEVKKTTLKLQLTNFIAPLEYVPQDIREKITKWESWIDYWAVDFDFKGDTFHNQWQSYRTRKNNKIDITATHTYEKPGTYTVQVKVIDLLGNDSTRTLRVEVG